MPVKRPAERTQVELDCRTECYENSIHRGLGRVKKTNRNVEIARGQWKAALYP